MGLFRYNLLVVNIDASNGYFVIKLEISENTSILFFWIVHIFSLVAYDLGWDHQLKWQFDSSVVRYSLRVIPLESCQYYYHYWNNRADADSIEKQIIKIVDFENITKEFLDDIIHTLITDGKIIDKVVTPIHTI